MSRGTTRERIATETSGRSARPACSDHRTPQRHPGLVDVLQGMQQSAGNRTVTRLLSGPHAGAQGATTGLGFKQARQNVLPGFIRDALSEGGQPLSNTANPLAGEHDLGGVRIHQGPRASNSADLLNADAYTVGSDIVFGQGQFAPGSRKGRELLRHELMHVLQNRQSAVRPARLISRTGDAAEHAADSAHAGQGTSTAPSAQVQRRPKSDGAQLPTVVAVPDPAAGVVRVLANGEGVAEIVVPPGAPVQGSAHAHVQWVDQGEGSYRIVISTREGAAARVTPAFQAVTQVHTVRASETQQNIQSTEGEKDLSAAQPGLLSLGPEHHILHPPYRLVPYARDRDNPVIEQYTAYNTETQTIEHVIPVEQLEAFLSNTGAWAKKDTQRAHEQAALELANNLQSIAEETSAVIGKINRNSGVDRLPTADDAYAGHLGLAQVVSEDLPSTQGASVDYAITRGQYKIYPQTKTVDGEQRVLYYVAYNTYVGRVEWAIPPSDLDQFLSNPQQMLNAAALIIDAQNLGQPGVKELNPEQLAYARYMHALVVEQSLSKALPQVGAAWKAKFDEWRENPASFLLYAAQFVPAGGGKPSPSAPRSRPPSVSANRAPSVSQPARPLTTPAASRPSRPAGTTSPKPTAATKAIPAASDSVKPAASPTQGKTTTTEMPIESKPTISRESATSTSKSGATDIAKGHQYKTSAETLKNRQDLKQQTLNQQNPGKVSEPTPLQQPKQPSTAADPVTSSKPAQPGATDISKGRSYKTSAKTRKNQQDLNHQARDKAGKATQMPGTERSPSPSEPASQPKPLEHTRQYDMAVGQTHVAGGNARTHLHALENQPRPKGVSGSSKNPEVPHTLRVAETPLAGNTVRTRSSRKPTSGNPPQRKTTGATQAKAQPKTSQKLPDDMQQRIDALDVPAEQQAQFNQAVRQIRARAKSDPDAAESLLQGLERRFGPADVPPGVRSDVAEAFDEASGMFFPSRNAAGVHTQNPATDARIAQEQRLPRRGQISRTKNMEGERLGTMGGREQAAREGIDVLEWDTPQKWKGDFGKGLDGIGRRGQKRIILEDKYGSSKLGVDRDGHVQMSNEAVGKKIAELEAVGDTATARELLTALDRGDLQGAVYWTRQLKDGYVTTRLRAHQLRDRLSRENISPSGLISYSRTKVRAAYEKRLAELKQALEKGDLKGLKNL